MYFSSAFNTIISWHLTRKLSLLCQNKSLSSWTQDLLTRRPQSVRIKSSNSSITTVSTGVTIHFWHDCGGFDPAYRDEVQWLSDWCRAHDLSLNVDKTKSMLLTSEKHSMIPLRWIQMAPLWRLSREFSFLVFTEKLTWTASFSLHPSRISPTCGEFTPSYCVLLRDYREHLHHGLVLELLCSEPQDSLADCDRTDHQSLRPFLQNKLHLQSHQHCGWTHPTLSSTPGSIKRVCGIQAWYGEQFRSLSHKTPKTELYFLHTNILLSLTALSPKHTHTYFNYSIRKKNHIWTAISCNALYIIPSFTYCYFLLLHNYVLFLIS